MKTSTSFIISLSLLFVMPITAPTVTAQTGVSYSSETDTRIDLVAADLNSPAAKDATHPYTRASTRTSDILHMVHITDAMGTTRMRGSYLDKALRIPHGHFTYYYPNGNVESTGDYYNGSKIGTWPCMTPNGEKRADRVYLGLDWDELQVAVGIASKARVVEGVEVAAEKKYGVE